MSYRQDGARWNGDRYMTATSHEAASPAFKISYDPKTDTYVILNPYESATFGPATSLGGLDHFQVFETASGTTSDRLMIYGDPDGKGWGAKPPIELSYLNLAIWSHRDTAADLVRDTYQLFGFPTKAASMPRTGTAFYNTFVTGSTLHQGGSGSKSEVTGSASILADFGSGTVDTELALIRRFGDLIGTFSGSASIDGNRFVGNFDTSDATNFKAGSFNGGFFGPEASEVGYTFLIHLYPADPYGGASLRVQNDWIVGAVVGSELDLPGP